MKPYKIVLLIILSIFLAGALALRIYNVDTAERTSTYFGRKKMKELGLITAEYLPVSNEIKIGDSLVFKPGIIWLHPNIDVKHRLFILNEYYEKSPYNVYSLMYDEGNQSENSNLVLTPFKEDAICEQFPEYIGSWCAFEDTVIDSHNNRFHYYEYDSIDTLKYYIKRIISGPNQSSNHRTNEFILDKEPLDSVLFYKNKDQQ